MKRNRMLDGIIVWGAFYTCDAYTCDAVAKDFLPTYWIEVPVKMSAHLLVHFCSDKCLAEGMGP